MFVTALARAYIQALYVWRGLGFHRGGSVCEVGCTRDGQNSTQPLRGTPPCGNPCARLRLRLRLAAGLCVLRGTPLCAQGLSALCCRLCDKMCLRITLRSAQAILSLTQAITLHCEGSVSSRPSAVLRCAQHIRRGSLGSTYGSAVRACSPLRTTISLLQRLCAHQRVLRLMRTNAP